MNKQDKEMMERLYTNWCEAEFELDCIYEELGEDFTHPRFIEAANRARDLLFIFLTQRTRSLHHIALKLQVASDVEDYLTDAANPACRDIAPRAVVGAMQDLQAMA